MITLVEAIEKFLGGKLKAQICQPKTIKNKTSETLGIF